MFQIYMKLIKSLIKIEKQQRQQQKRSKSEHRFVEKQSSYFVTKFQKD